MARSDDEEKVPQKVTDIDAVQFNVKSAVAGFVERWMPMPRFYFGVEIMDARQLRDAMGLRASMDWGDPWPTAEQLLLEQGFRWHWLGSSRVMFLRERDDYTPDDGWEEVNEESEE